MINMLHFGARTLAPTAASKPSNEIKASRRRQASVKAQKGRTAFSFTCVMGIRPRVCQGEIFPLRVSMLPVPLLIHKKKSDRMVALLCCEDLHFQCFRIT